jgi:hypothetical protein
VHAADQRHRGRPVLQSPGGQSQGPNSEAGSLRKQTSVPELARCKKMFISQNDPGAQGTGTEFCFKYWP